MDVTVAGLPIVGGDEIGTPLSAVVCVKGLSEDGEITYWTRATDGLKTAEAIGMAVVLLDDLLHLRREAES